jgi:hypothetical protein
MNGDKDSLDNWYTAGEAAKVISKNSNREVKAEYLRSLARIGKVDTKKIGERTTLYLKLDVDAYRVEDRGEKVARIQKARAAKVQQ